MKKLIYTIFFVFVITTLFTNIVYAEDKNTEPQIVVPDVVVDFDDDKYWSVSYTHLRAHETRP